MLEGGQGAWLGLRGITGVITGVKAGVRLGSVELGSDWGQ